MLDKKNIYLKPFECVKRMGSGSFKNVINKNIIYKCFMNHIYLIYMYKEDLV